MTNSATVVLLGFSTAGKSTIVGRFKDKYGAKLDTLDTDDVIASSLARSLDPTFSNKAHIYDVFFHFVKNGDTSKALEYIADEERRVLKTNAKRQGVPLLVAPGPNTVFRDPEWSEFCKALTPTFVYLKLDKSEVYYGLHNRRQGYLNEPSLQQRKKDIGSWDQHVITEYRNRQWVELRKSVVLPKIAGHLCRFIDRCKPFVSANNTFAARAARNGPERIRLDNFIEEGLGLTGSDRQ